MVYVYNFSAAVNDMLTVGQAVPEIPLSVGSKLELLLRACAFAQCPYTSLGPVHSRICPRMHIAMPCILYVYSNV